MSKQAKALAVLVLQNAALKDERDHMKGQLEAIQRDRDALAAELRAVRRNRPKL